MFTSRQLIFSYKHITCNTAICPFYTGAHYDASTLKRPQIVGPFSGKFDVHIWCTMHSSKALISFLAISTPPTIWYSQCC